MKNIFSILSVCVLLNINNTYAQNITNTIGAGGLFKVKDATTDFLILNQSNGIITLPLQLAGNQRGSIFKGSNRFLHTYNGAGADGYNTFLGKNSGNFTMGGVTYIEGSYNTGMGASTLSSLTTGYSNSAFGFNSLFSNTTGNNNSAFGLYCLYSNISGYSNTAVGRSTLYNNIAGNDATAIGYYAMYYANNTTNAFDNFNVAVGYESLMGSPTPANNTGNANTAIGYRTLKNNTTGSENTAIGYRSLMNNTSGEMNTAIGSGALYSNTTGYRNTAVGNEVLYDNTTGHNNTAIGHYSLSVNTTGYENTALGANSLHSNTIGRENSAFGYNSLYTNISGRQNTAIGHHSLELSTGNYNTALGFNAGSTVTTGTNLTLIGIDANPSSPTVTNQITLGNQYVSSLRCNVTTITSLSDARDKKNIRDLKLGIDFLMKLKPRIYNWDKREWYENNISDGSKMKEEPTAGFIAQELDEVQTTENAEWLNLVLIDNPDKWEATPGNLLPIIVKAVQELKMEKDFEIKMLKEENQKLKVKNQNLEERLSKFEEAQTILVKRLEQLESGDGNYKFQIVNTEIGNK